VSLQLSLRIIITFWKPQEAVLPSPSPGYATDMRTHLWHLLLPHFTARGLAAYERMQAFQTG
jgi:hypothetical protein